MVCCSSLDTAFPLHIKFNQNYRNLLIPILFLPLGIYTFGLFATDIFVNAGQVVTGNLAPHFLALCKPNYTALGCQQFTQFISSAEACSGNPDLIMKARKTFPSKDAALSIYAATYLAVSKSDYLILCCFFCELSCLVMCYVSTSMQHITGLHLLRLWMKYPSPVYEARCDKGG